MYKLTGRVLADETLSSGAFQVRQRPRHVDGATVGLAVVGWRLVPLTVTVVWKHYVYI